jgi:hypothetical protein
MNNISPQMKFMSHSNISINTNNITTIQKIPNNNTSNCQTQMIDLNNIILPNFDSNINKRSSAIKKECLSDDDVINKNLQKEENSLPNNKRLNYQMEKSNRWNKPKVMKNFHSTRTHRGKNIDYDEKVNLTNNLIGFSNVEY